MGYLKSELSRRNTYWVSKHRYYELLHWCLQYPEWKEKLKNLYTLASRSENKGNDIPDPTEKLAIKRAMISRNIELLEQTAADADERFAYYIFKAVTEGISFTKLKMQMNIPCEKDLYYETYRKFFWLLSQRKE